MESKETGRAATVSRADNVRARDADGRWLADDERSHKTERNRRSLKERDYLRAIVAEIGRDELTAVARRIVEDAKGDADVKVVNAAREWLGKYLLGNARVALDDCDDLPAIVKRR